MGSPHPGWYCLRCRRAKKLPYQQAKGIEYPAPNELEVQALIYAALVGDGWDAHMEVRFSGGRMDIVIFEEQQPWLVMEVKGYTPSEVNAVHAKAKGYADVAGCECVVVSSVEQALAAVDAHLASGH